MTPSATGFGHGKVILLGEHAVVHGHPALAAGLSAGVRAHVSDGTGVLTAPGWELDRQIGDYSPPGQAVSRLCERFKVPTDSVDIWLETEIPARAGLGSSAAMATAIARALEARTGHSVDLAELVSFAESIFHRTPSGIDSAASRHGGVGRFDKASGWHPLPVGAQLEICVGISGEEHDTGILVSGVAALCDAVPATHKVLETMGELAKAGERALAAGDLPTLGHLFNLAHGLLSAVGVSTPTLETLVYSARDAGALGAKLTGAGGGGAVIALATGNGDAIVRKWRAKGYYGFSTVIDHD